MDEKNKFIFTPFFPKDIETSAQIGIIIHRFNEIERLIKAVITNYLNSPRSNFVREVMLNSLVINFSNKKKILHSILVELRIPNKRIQEVNKNLNSLMTIRNAIAHSDQLFSVESDVVNRVSPPDQKLHFPSTISVFDNGKFIEKNFQDEYGRIEKYYNETKDFLIEMLFEIKELDQNQSDNDA